MTRPRIIERLARASRFPVTLLTAPAGFGKSVAVRDFVAAMKLDAVRYDVARDNVTLLTCVRGLCSALEPVAPTVVASLPQIQERILAAADPAREVTDWFAEHLNGAACTVVVDDLHFASPQALAFLVALVERTAGPLRWILATRSDAGLPVARWIGHGLIDGTVGEDDLRFTADDAIAAADAMQSPADAGEIDALLALTGGWPIAVAIALRTRTHSSDLRNAASGTREMIYRYLAEQVYGSLSRAQQRFLLETCVLRSFDLGIAEALGADAAFVQTLRADAMFLSEAAPAVYRYHDLFRDFLERELRRSGAAEWFRVHAEAAALLERRGDDGRALALAIRAGATERIEAILVHRGVALFERGDVETVAAALDAVPTRSQEDDATLLGLRAMLDASRGRYDLAEPRFVAALERAEDRELRASLVHRYAIELVRQGRDCIALLEPYGADETIPRALRLPILGTLATAYANAGRIDDAIWTIRDALDRGETIGDPMRAQLYHQAAYVHQFVPGREGTRSYAAAAVELALSCGLYELAARAYSILYTLASDEEDDPVAALAVLERLGECARKGASRQALVFGSIAAYEIEAERGNEAALVRLDGEIEGSEAILPLASSETLLPARALRAGWNGAFDRAYALLAGTAQRQGSDERRALRYAEIALYAYAAGNDRAGAAAVRNAVAAIRRARPGRRLVRSHLILALALLAANRTETAERHINAAQRLLTPAMRRLRALEHAVRTLSRAQRGLAGHDLVAAALERLHDENLGGIARLLAAICFPPADGDTREREIV